MPSLARRAQRAFFCFFNLAHAGGNCSANGFIFLLSSAPPFGDADSGLSVLSSIKSIAEKLPLVATASRDLRAHANIVRTVKNHYKRKSRSGAIATVCGIVSGVAAVRPAACGAPVHPECAPFAPKTDAFLWQNERGRGAKGLRLWCKRTAFGAQKESVWRGKGPHGVAHSVLRRVQGEDNQPVAAAHAKLANFASDFFWCEIREFCGIMDANIVQPV